MKRASALLIVSIGLCRRGAVGIILMLCLCGCGARQAAQPVLNVPDCPAPSAPALPPLDASEPLESPANAARLLERDDVIRAYINGLNAALDCFRARRETWEMN